MLWDVQKVRGWRKKNRDVEQRDGGGGSAGVELTRSSVLLASPQVLQIAQQKRQLLGTLISAAGKDALKTKRTET